MTEHTDESTGRATRSPHAAWALTVGVLLLGCGHAAAPSAAAPEDPTSPPEETEAPSEAPDAVPGERRMAPGADDSGPDGKVCGGFAGNTCSEQEYCAYEAGAYCGAADASATCKPRPEVCTYDYRPVCGCDNKTYGNACAAAAAGQGVLSEGECPPSQDEPIGE